MAPAIMSSWLNFPTARPITPPIGCKAAVKNQHRAFAAGLIIGHQKARLESLLNSAEDAFSDFKKAKTFWKGFPPAPAPALPALPADHSAPEALSQAHK